VALYSVGLWKKKRRKKRDPIVVTKRGKEGKGEW
jgi:hypothetical protein